jgi:hypothetical protein
MEKETRCHDHHGGKGMHPGIVLGLKHGPDAGNREFETPYPARELEGFIHYFPAGAYYLF